MVIAVSLIGLAVVVYALFDIWRNAEEPSAYKWGWSLVAVGGVLSLAAWRVGSGWFVGLPVGALAYLLLARSGPLRRGRRRGLA